MTGEDLAVKTTAHPDTHGEVSEFEYLEQHSETAHDNTGLFCLFGKYLRSLKILLHS